jgi:hypothetical protein
MIGYDPEDKVEILARMVGGEKALKAVQKFNAKNKSKKSDRVKERDR